MNGSVDLNYFVRRAAFIIEKINDTNGGVQFSFLAHMEGCNSCFLPYARVQIVFPQNEGANLKDPQYAGCNLC